MIHLSTIAYAIAIKLNHGNIQKYLPNIHAFFSSTSTPAKPHHDSFKIKRGKSNRMGNWERFGAFNQDHQSSPVYKSQRQAWNQDRGPGQNFQARGKENYF